MRFNIHKFILLIYVCAFLALLSFSAKAAVNYIGEDIDTKGNWKSKYGALGAVLFDQRGDQELPGKIDEYELINVQYWNDPPGAVWEDERAPLSIDAPEERHAGVIFNTIPFYVNLKMSVDNYQVAFYFWDWNEQSRITDVIAYVGDEPPDKQSDVTIEGDNHINGVYEIWEIAGSKTVSFRFSHTSGVNSMVMGFFVNGPEAVSSSGKLTTQWGNLKQ